FVESDDRIARPILRQHRRIVEADFLLQRPAQRLDDAAGDLIDDAVRIDDVAAIVGADCTYDADTAIARVHLDLHGDGHEGGEVLVAGKGDAATTIALLLEIRPAELLGAGGEHGTAAFVLEVTQAIFERIGAG